MPIGVDRFPFQEAQALQSLRFLFSLRFAESLQQSSSQS